MGLVVCPTTWRSVKEIFATAASNNCACYSRYSSYHAMLHKQLSYAILAVQSTQPSTLSPPSTPRRTHYSMISKLSLTLRLQSHRVLTFSIPIDARPRSPLLLHGRQVPRLLHNHHRLLARPNRRHLWWLLNCSMPANRRQGSIDRGVQFQEEVEHVGRNRK